MTDYLTGQTQTATRPTITPAKSGLLQRQCACGQHSGGVECESCRKKHVTGTLQRAAVQPSAPSPQPSEVPSIVHEVLRSPGQPLDAQTRAFMEPRFGHDFSQVRVHTDAKAAESARTVNALAYTVGRDVVLGPNGYGPSKSEERRLLAHELAHVVQQRAAVTTGTANIIAADHPTEIEADHVAQTVAAGQSASPRLVTGSSVQRDVGWARRGRNDPYGYEEDQTDIDRLQAGQYVDVYDYIIYNLGYRSERGRLSKYLQVYYQDGTKIDVNIDAIGEESMTAIQMFQTMFDHLGDGRRVFPQSMNRSTTPRLHSAKHEVLKIMDDYNTLFILMTFPTVWMLLTLTASPGSTAPRTQRRAMPLREFEQSGSGGNKGEITEPPGQPIRQPGQQRTSVPETGTRGSQRASSQARAEQEAAQAEPLLALREQQIRDSLVAEHPGLHPRVAAAAARGGTRAMGPGGPGADVPLATGGGREVSVHSGEFTAQSIGRHLQEEAAQAGTTEIFLQINSPGATRGQLQRMVPAELQNAYVELRGRWVRFFGPGGDTWWSGRFGGPQQ
jgi:hypothetical protein